eukprot:gene27320-34019_t
MERLPSSKTLSSFVKLCAGICAVTSLALVSVWASVDEANYLHKASWKHNLFAWHPVLMVAGFFFSQSIAILSWGWPIVEVAQLQESSLSCSLRKLSHVIWQTTAFTTLIVALYAIFKTKQLQSVTNLSSLHSWVGITVASAFAFNYLGGMAFELVKRLSRDGQHRTLESMVPYVRAFHKTTGVLLYGVSAMAILTGISIFQGHSCQRTITTPDTNPAEHYDLLLPSGCKIANGLGISVLVTALLVLLSVAIHYQVVDLSVPSREGDEQDNGHGEQEGLQLKDKNGRGRNQTVSTNSNGNGGKSYQFCMEGVTSQRDRVRRSGEADGQQPLAGGGKGQQSYQRQ